MIGRRLAHFEITAKLGEGGMGEVYRATDTKLGREVAVKVLPQALVHDEERLARFEREAKVLASLNHSGIAGIHSLEEADGIRFLAMELVAGEAMDARLDRGPLSVEEAVEVARQMAVALEAAHEQGIVHRDLKPANVMVTPDGEVKILDFGLAKAVEPAAAGASPALSHSPTITQQMTQAGVLMGTAAYMSPEQARAQEADKRSDIWSFGVVLLEMLTGSNSFGGDTVSDTLAAVLRAEPELDQLPEEVPEVIRRLLERCLEKDSRLRLRDIGEARILLGRDGAAAPDPPTQLAEPSRAARPPMFKRPAFWLAIGAVALMSAGLTYLTSRQEPSVTSDPVRKYRVARFSFGFGWISPDGNKLAYVGDSNLWVRDLSELEPRPVPGASASTGWMIWSHDSRSLAYADANKLWKVDLAGMKRRLIADLPTSSTGRGGGGWLPDGRILFTTGQATGLLEVSDQGSETRQILAPDPETEVDFHDARLLPDGRGILFAVHLKDRSDSKIMLFADGEKRVVIEIEGQTLEQPVYSPTGHILFKRSPSNLGLWAVPFDLDRLTVTGAPFLVAPHATSPSVSRDGTLAYVELGAPRMREMVWVDRSGTVLARVAEPKRGLRNPTLSADGRCVVLPAFENETWDLWEYDLETGLPRRLTTSPDIEQAGSLSPFGLLAYATRGLDPEIGVLNVETGQEWARLTAGGRPAWSPDGRYLVWELFGARGLWMQEFSPQGPLGEARLLVDHDRDESEPAISPDGDFFSYLSDDSGTFEVYVARFPTAAGRRQVSTAGAWTHSWNPEGEEILYLSHDDDLFVTPIGRRGDIPVPRTPRRLFSEAISAQVIAAPKGRLLMIRDVDPEQSQSSLVVAENWLAEFE